VKDLGIAAIEEMVASQAGGVDWVVVELTGIADPGTYGEIRGNLYRDSFGLAPIARSFWANEEMGDLILDGVICVVDSRNVLKVRQLAPRGVPLSQRP
jgi:G3E family GTPase